MNKVTLLGRLARDPDVRYSQSEQPICIARYTLAVDRRRSRNNQNDDQPTADFISCVAFGKAGEFAEKYLHKGSKICISGRIQTGSYTKADGTKVYTTNVVAEEQEFAESKAEADQRSQGQAAPPQTAQPQQGYNTGYQNTYQAPATPQPQATGGYDDFMNIPDSYQEELPWN